MGKTVNKGCTLTQRELKAAKYKRFKGNKSEGQGFADIRKKRIASKYLKIVAKEKQQLKDWSKKLQKIYAEAEEEAQHIEEDELRSKTKKKRRGKLAASAKNDGDNDADIDNEKLEKEEAGTSKDVVNANQHIREKDGQLFSPKQRETKKQKTSAFYRQQKDWERKKEEKQKKLEEIEAHQREKEAAIERRRKDKSHRHKLLAKRNYKGQPNLASRMELLLEQITKQRPT